MEKQKIFIPHRITDENSLPKKQGKYFVISKGGGEIYKRDLDPFIKFWMNDFECWLEEKEVPSDEEIKEWAYKECDEGWVDTPMDYISVANDVLSKLGIK